MPPAEKLYVENLALKAENEDLRAQVAWFRQQVFGSRSEKLAVDSPVQTNLGLPETARAERPVQTVTYERRTPAPEKRPLPAELFAGLPVADTIELVPDEVKAEPMAFERISEERTFEVDLIGPKLVKRELVRPKFRRKADREMAPVMRRRCPAWRWAVTRRRGSSPISSSPSISITCRCIVSSRCRRSGARR